MHIAAYLYTDPQLDEPIDENLWGWEVDAIYHDQGVGTQRPQLEGLIGHMPPPDYLLVRGLGELGDSLETVTRNLSKLEAAGIIVIATEQTYQTSATGDNSYQLAQALTEIALVQQQRRIRRGHAANRLKAIPPPGKPPYGYRRGKQRYVIDRTTVPVLKAFFEQFLLYGSLRGAVKYIAKQYGKKISVSTGRRWLEHPVYRGHTRYGDGGIVLNTHRPLLAEGEAAQIDRLLRRHRSLPPKTASASRSLAGLVTCQQCRTKLTISQVSGPRRDHRYVYMRVARCPHKCKSLSYDALLTKTIEAICAELPKAVANRQYPRENPKQPLDAEIAAKQSVLETLPKLIEQGILDQMTADMRAYQVQTELAHLVQQRSQLPPVNLEELSRTVSIPQFWEGLSESERRFFFREFIQEIEIIRDRDVWSVELKFTF
ncbi:MAG: recombinase family protein [Cyanobacteria bacterium J06642_11]